MSRSGEGRSRLSTRIISSGRDPVGEQAGDERSGAGADVDVELVDRPVRGQEVERAQRADLIDAAGEPAAAEHERCLRRPLAARLRRRRPAARSRRPRSRRPCPSAAGIIPMRAVAAPLSRLAWPPMHGLRARIADASRRPLASPPVRRPATAAGPDRRRSTPVARPGSPLAARAGLSSGQLRDQIAAALAEAGGAERRLGLRHRRGRRRGAVLGRRPRARGSRPRTRSCSRPRPSSPRSAPKGTLETRVYAAGG